MVLIPFLPLISDFNLLWNDLIAWVFTTVSPPINSYLWHTMPLEITKFSSFCYTPCSSVAKTIFRATYWKTMGNIVKTFFGIITAQARNICWLNYTIHSESVLIVENIPRQLLTLKQGIVTYIWTTLPGSQNLFLTKLHQV